jgi:hypothetical protein
MPAMKTVTGTLHKYYPPKSDKAAGLVIIKSPTSNGKSHTFQRGSVWSKKWQAYLETLPEGAPIENLTGEEQSQKKYPPTQDENGKDVYENAWNIN